MFFDTHCHLNFGTFDGKVDKVIDEAKKAGVNRIVIPGTDVPTSKKAVMIAEKFDGIYAAVGIHPHHVFELFKARERNFFAPVGTLPAGNGESQVAKNLIPSLVIPAEAGIQTHWIPDQVGDDIKSIEKLLTNPKVVAVGEVGIDRHIYQKTKYPDYKIEEEFVKLQKIILIEQIKLSIKYDKSLVLHNREAKADMIEVLNNIWDKKLEGRSVFHCCEPDFELLNFAKDHKMFIGVDGDITYYKEKSFGFAQDKQEFIKTVPLEMLVLETDSPFLNPEPNRAKEGGTNNEPKNIKVIAEFIAKLKGITVDEVAKITTNNARRLFSVSSPCLP